VHPGRQAEPGRRRAGVDALRGVALGGAFASLFVVPFLLFGAEVERLSLDYLDGEQATGASMLVAGALLAGDPLLPVPSSVVATVLAARVGFKAGALTVAVSLSLGCVLGYYLGRSGGWVWQRSGRAIPDGFSRWVRRYGIAAVLLCRPVPILAEASLMIAGAARVRARPLLGWCVLTQIVLGTAYAFAGSGWGDDRWNGWAVFTGAVLVPACGGLVVLALVARDRARTRPHSRRSGAVESVEQQPEHDETDDGSSDPPRGARQDAGPGGRSCSRHGGQDEGQTDADQGHDEQLNGDDPVLGPLTVEDRGDEGQAQDAGNEEDHDGDDALRVRAHDLRS
jgi:uncharacterized membrane protein YdjX (TVP38/TMEM64 family)